MTDYRGPIVNVGTEGHIDHGKASSGNSDLLSGLLTASAELSALRDEHFLKLAAAFSGMRILVNPLLPENEIAIVCGSKVYKLLLEKTEAR